MVRLRCRRMTTKISNIQIRKDSKLHKDCGLEIDDESNIISLLRFKKTLTGKKEEVLCELPYSIKDFPQFENYTLNVKNYGVIVESEKDRKKIIEVLTKPLLELEKKNETSIKKAEDAMKKMLLSRAESLEVLIKIQKNPRKELFNRFPDILANSTEPIAETVNRQKNSIAAALAELATEMSTLEQEIGNCREITILFQKLIIAIGTAQDALFEGGEFKLRNSQDILQSLDVTSPFTENLSISQFTNSSLNEFIQKKHQYAVNIALGVVRCNNCEKYYTPDSKSCPYCASKS